MPYETIVCSRTELYEQVWAEPVRTVAKRYSISDVALGKICRKLRVPVPGRGYWARKAAGKVPARPSLRPLPEGMATEIQVYQRRHTAGPDVDASEAARVKEEKRGPPIEVSAVLVDPHPLVARAAKALRRARPVDGLVSSRMHRCLNIMVAPSTVDRALRVADALVKALQARKMVVDVATIASAKKRSHAYSHPAATPSASNPVSRVQVNEEWIEWSLTERSKAEMGPQPTPPRSMPKAQRESWLSWNRPRPVRVPNGLLVLEIHGAEPLGTRRTWKDGKHQRVESRLNDFIAGLFATADAMKRHRAEIERQRKEWDDRERRRLEAEQRAAEDARNAEDLQEMIGRWRLAMDIREYLGEVSAALSEAGMEVSSDSRLGVLLAWAPDYAARIDPVEALRAMISRAEKHSGSR
jgi:hypothetical protein